MTRTTTEERTVPRWFWGAAFVVGVAFLTLVRPVLQHIPDPPPLLGELPPVTGRSASGAETTVGGAGGLRLVQLVPRGESTAASDRLMRKLGYVLALMGTPSVERVSVVESEVGQERKAALRQAVRAGADWAHVGVAEAPFAVWQRSLPADGGGAGAPAGSVALVDRAGVVRGWYAADAAEVVSEVYHRAVHADRAGNLDRSGPR